LKTTGAIAIEDADSKLGLDLLQQMRQIDPGMKPIAGGNNGSPRTTDSH